jgi:hypothetical protein
MTTKDRRAVDEYCGLSWVEDQKSSDENDSIRFETWFNKRCAEYGWIYTYETKLHQAAIYDRQNDSNVFNSL